MDIAAAVCFLAPVTRLHTGPTFLIDGGRHPPCRALKQGKDYKVIRRERMYVHVPRQRLDVLSDGLPPEFLAAIDMQPSRPIRNDTLFLRR